ncbi:MAG: DUF2490 domain-containing protein [Legionella sp.]|nr:MAG: DUF2490 domain-containing protein [Legionella sp.]
MPHIIKIIGTFFALILCSFKTTSATQHDVQSWFNVTAIGNFNQKDNTDSKIKFWLEGQERVGDEVSRFTQTLLRPGIGYSFNTNLSLWVGYAWTYTGLPLTSTPFAENRIWEQLLWVKSYDSVTLTSRTRIEQRFLQNNPKTAYRARQLFKVGIPLNHSPKWSLVSSEEVFIHKNNFNGPNSKGFDQNRFFIGIGYEFTPNLITEIGYMNQYIQRVGIPNFLANIASFNLFLSL